MLELRQETALSHRKGNDTTYVSMREMTERGMIDLRGLASDRKFMTAVKGVIGTDLPKAPRTSAAWGEIKVLWLSIDQWLITCPRAKVESLLSELNAALKNIHALAVNVSDMRSIIRIEGERVKEVVMKGTSLDLTDGDMGTGFVKRMKFAEVAALLSIIDDKTIDIYVFRSYADYVWEFLLKAARRGSEVAVLNPR